MRDRIRDELHLERQEVLQKERHQETIFTKGKQVPLVQRVYVPFGVLVDDTVGDDDSSAFVRGKDKVERDASRKTRYRAEQILEHL